MLLTAWHGYILKVNFITTNRLLRSIKILWHFTLDSGKSGPKDEAAIQSSQARTMRWTAPSSLWPLVDMTTCIVFFAGASAPSFVMKKRWRCHRERRGWWLSSSPSCKPSSVWFGGRAYTAAAYAIDGASPRSTIESIGIRLPSRPSQSSQKTFHRLCYQLHVISISTHTHAHTVAVCTMNSQCIIKIVHYACIRQRSPPIECMHRTRTMKTISLVARWMIPIEWVATSGERTWFDVNQEYFR